MQHRTYLLVGALFCGFAAASAKASPIVTVQARQKASGQIVKQVTTDSRGKFVLGAVAPGDYNLEFRCARPHDARDKEFTLIVNGVKVAGRQTVAGTSLLSGVGLAVEIPRGAVVNGQIATGAEGAKMKTLVWVPPMIGSNMPGRWAEKGSVDEVLSSNRGIIPLYRIREAQDHGYNFQ